MTIAAYTRARTRRTGRSRARNIALAAVTTLSLTAAAASPALAAGGDTVTTPAHMYSTHGAHPALMVQLLTNDALTKGNINDIEAACANTQGAIHVRIKDGHVHNKGQSGGIGIELTGKVTATTFRGTVTSWSQEHHCRKTQTFSVPRDY